MRITHHQNKSRYELILKLCYVKKNGPDHDQPQKPCTVAYFDPTMPFNCDVYHQLGWFVIVMLLVSTHEFVKKMRT